MPISPPVKPPTALPTRPDRLPNAIAPINPVLTAEFKYGIGSSKNSSQSIS